MDTLIIYDTTGFIISQMSGSVREPVGIPFLWVEVPESKKVASVDVSGENHVLIFVDLSKSELTLIKEQQALMQLALDDIILSGGTF